MPTCTCYQSWPQQTKVLPLIELTSEGTIRSHVYFYFPSFANIPQPLGLVLWKQWVCSVTVQPWNPQSAEWTAVFNTHLLNKCMSRWIKHKNEESHTCITLWTWKQFHGISFSNVINEYDLGNLILQMNVRLGENMSFMQWHTPCIVKRWDFRQNNFFTVKYYFSWTAPTSDHLIWGRGYVSKDSVTKEMWIHLFHASKSFSQNRKHQMFFSTAPTT